MKHSYKVSMMLRKLKTQAGIKKEFAFRNYFQTLCTWKMDLRAALNQPAHGDYTLKAHFKIS